MKCETQESEVDMQNIYIYTSLKHTCVNQHLIVLNLYSVSINKILVTEFIPAKVSRNLNLM